MSEDNQDLIRFANKRFSEVLLDGLRLFAKNWLRLILPFAIFLIISIIISNIITVDLNWQYIQLTPAVEAIYEMDPSFITEADLNLLLQYLVLTYGINMITSIFGTIFTALAMSIAGTYLYRYYANYTGNLEEGFKGSFNKKLLIIILLFGIFVPLGTLLLYIPSVIILGYYIFIFFTYRDKSIEKPLKEARNLSRGAFWKIIGVFLITTIIVSVVNFLYQSLVVFAWNFDSATYLSWYTPSTRNYYMIILDDLIYYQFIGIIFSPLFICLLTPLYTTIKARHQLGYTYQKGYYSMQQRYTQRSNIPTIDNNLAQQDHIQQDQGFYCPFCGFHMPTKLKFCANCGESLDFES